MADDAWQWKIKSGASGGLLYESGNWGDLLKMLWVTSLIQWKQRSGAAVNYFDPFAGDVAYPLGKKTRFRLAQAGMDDLPFLHTPYLEMGSWPSAAAVALEMVKGTAVVWDADIGRRRNWLTLTRAVVAEGDSGWHLMKNRECDPNAVWLLDPYDFLAEWREWLPAVVEQAKTTSILVYIYNRSAKNAEAFANYRAFKNALASWRKELPLRLGRVAADAFLPRAHHEMLFLPGERDREATDLPLLWDVLEKNARQVAAGLERSGVYDC